VTALSTGVTLLQPWPMQVVVDHVLARTPPSGLVARLAAVLPGAARPTGLLAWAVVAGLALFGLHAAVDAVLARRWVRVGQRMVYDLARDLFGRLLRRSLLFHARTPVGDSLARVTGDSWSVHAVADTLVFAPGHALLTAAALVAVMARLDPVLTLVAVAVAPVMAAGPLLVRRPMRAAADVRREVESLMQSHVQQTLSSVAVVQAFAQEEREHGRFREYGRAAVHAHRRGVLATKLGELGVGLTTTFATAAVLWVGARRVLGGQVSTGTVLVFLAYLASLHEQLKALADAYAGLQATSASARRAVEVLEPRPRWPTGPARRRSWGGRAGRVTFDAVTAGYAPGAPCWRDWTWRWRPASSWRWSARPGRGRARSPRSCRASSTRGRGPCASTAATCGRCGWPTCARRWPSCPGAGPLPAHRGGEHRVRPARGHARRGRGGGACRGRARRRRAAARRLRHGARRRRRDAQRGGAAAAGAGARAAPRRARAGARRADERARPGRRAPGAGRDRPARRRPHDAAHRAPALDGGGRDRVVVLAGGRVVEAGPPAELLARGGAYARLLDASPGPLLDGGLPDDAADAHPGAAHPADAEPRAAARG
jgi:ABC-type multidrug transport system fused ATPase/permease subunit